MMNKAILMGRLTSDPEVRYTQTTNTMVVNFALAVNRRFVKEGEERQADFINIVAWNKTAEFCSKYFKKGQQVAVIGRIQTRTWDDEEEKKHYVTEVVAEELYPIWNKSKEQEVQDEINDKTELENKLNNSEVDLKSIDILPF